MKNRKLRAKLGRIKNRKAEGKYYPRRPSMKASFLKSCYHERIRAEQDLERCLGRLEEGQALKLFKKLKEPHEMLYA